MPKHPYKNVSGHPIDLDGVVVGAGEFAELESSSADVRAAREAGFLAIAQEPEKPKKGE